MKVWLTRSNNCYAPCVEVWLKKPKLHRPFGGVSLFVNSAGDYNPNYTICWRGFREMTSVRLKPGECRCVDLNLSIKPVTPKRKRVKRRKASRNVLRGYRIRALAGPIH